MTGGTGGTALHEFVPNARKSRIDDHGALPGAVRLIVVAKSAPYENSQKGGRRQSLRRITLQNTLKVISHPLYVGLTNVVGGGV
jgi:hypothetical protein